MVINIKIKSIYFLFAGILIILMLILTYYGLIFLDSTVTYHYAVKYTNLTYLVSYPDTNSTRIYRAEIISDTVKTSGGLPHLKNDIYQTVSICVGPASWVPTTSSHNSGCWMANIFITGIDASRLNGSDNKTYSCESQNLSLSINNNSIGYWAPDLIFVYPYNGSTMNETIENRYGQVGFNLTQVSTSVAIGEINNYSTFEFNNTTFVKLVKTINEFYPNRPMEFSYKDSKGSDVSDCGYIVRTVTELTPSKPEEISVNSTLYWGLFDKNDANISLKITLPPNPEYMTKAERDLYGIHDDSGYWTDNMTIEVI